MDEKAFLKTIAEFQGIDLDADRIERLLAPGKMFDQLKMIKSIVLTTDVVGFRPKEDLDFFKEDEI